MNNNLFSFFKLSSAERKFFFQALLLLVKYRIKLKKIPLKELIAQSQQETRKYQKQQGQSIALHRTCRLIEVAAQLVPLSTCLSNALAGQILFAANQHPSKLHVGVRTTPEKGFEAHAWLTWDGAILLGKLPDLASYKELPSLPVILHKEL